MQKLKIRWIDVMVVVGIVGYAWYMAASRPKVVKPDTDDSRFAQAVDLSPLHTTAVQAEGRLRSFESHAQSLLSLVTGSRLIDGQSYSFTYLDLIFRPQAYVDREIIYLKKKPVRLKVVNALREVIKPEEAESIMDTGMATIRQMEHPSVQQLRRELSKDLIRTARAATAINTALGVSNGLYLRSTLRVFAPDGATSTTPWRSIDEFITPDGVAVQEKQAMLASSVEGVSTEKADRVRASWTSLQEAWLARDAEATNTAVAGLAAVCREMAGSAYPSTARLSWEAWYFRANSMTWVWLVYLTCIPSLLMALIYKWRGAYRVGMGLFVIAFGFHTASLILRWYISGRWPNANMFEAVTTAAWFGGFGALILEAITRKTAFRSIFALGSGVMSMVALMACHFLPAEIDSAIRNKMAALNDIWLYIHTNVIIWSYAVIGAACIPALLLLRHRWCQSWDNGAIPKGRLLILPIGLAALNFSLWMVTMHVIAPARYPLTEIQLMMHLGILFGGSSMIVIEILSARERAAAGVRIERSASGGASALIAGGSGISAGDGGNQLSTGQVLDGATMVLVEVAFIMLWAGTVMGAIWADHSWGRPWGWDPKEVFALNTFIIFVVLIHVRFRVRDKAFWTAVIAVIGFEVMLFNWIVVNFVITGLHSYA